MIEKYHLVQYQLIICDLSTELCTAVGRRNEKEVVWGLVKISFQGSAI